MNITGYKISEAIDQHRLKLDALNTEFTDSLTTFEGDAKRKPSEVSAEIVLEERAIADLQTVQARFNLAVKVDVLGDSMTLMQAIKRKGGVGRVGKLWKGAVPVKSRYDGIRTTDQIIAKPQVTQTEVTRAVSMASRSERAMQAAIAMANAQHVEIDGIDPSLFEVSV